MLDISWIRVLEKRFRKRSDYINLSVSSVHRGNLSTQHIHSLIVKSSSSQNPILTEHCTWLACAFMYHVLFVWFYSYLNLKSGIHVVVFRSRTDSRGSKQC